MKQGKIKGLVENQFKKMKKQDEKPKDTGNSKKDSVEEGEAEEDSAEEETEEVEKEEPDAETEE